MELELDKTLAAYHFSSFSYDTVVVGKQQYRSSLIVTPKELFDYWPPKKLDDITQDDLEIIIALQPELSLLGTGHKLKFPMSNILEGVATANIGIEFMDSRAACRTYNILASENRRIAAGIILEHSDTNSP
jgi:uncharacterized protein